MRYKTVFFDLDGTLTNSEKGITNCVQYALDDFGIQEPDINRLRRFIGPPLVDSFMKEYGFTMEQAVKAVEKYRERYARIGIFENSLYEGIPCLLRQLKKREKCVVLTTSKPLVYAKQILEKFEVAKYFDFVSGSELDGTRNQKIEVIEHALRHVDDVEPSQIVLVGDTRFDILGAKSFGFVSVGVKYGFAEVGELEQAGADYLFDDVNGLTEFLIGG